MGRNNWLRFCGDCGVETKCQWCDICSTYLCDDCNPGHDCLEDILDPHEDDGVELDSPEGAALLDEILDQDDEDEGSGHA